MDEETLEALKRILAEFRVVKNDYTLPAWEKDITKVEAWVGGLVEIKRTIGN